MEKLNIHYEPVELKPSNRRMVIDEKVKSQKFRLFKWSKKCSDYPTSCLLVLQVNNDIYSSKKKSLICTTAKYIVHSTMDAIHMFSSRDRAERCIHIAVNKSGYFFSADTIRILAKDVADFLFGCFRFNVASFSEPATPTYVVVVDVLATTIMGAMDMDMDMDERFLNQEDLGPYIVDSNYIYDSVKCLLNEIGNSTMKVDCVPETKEFLTLVEPSVKEVSYDIVSGTDGDEEEAKCSICFEGYTSGAKAMVTSCSHKFHSKCLIEWMLRRESCPLCRGLCVIHV